MSKALASIMALVWLLGLATAPALARAPVKAEGHWAPAGRATHALIAKKTARYSKRAKRHQRGSWAQQMRVAKKIQVAALPSKPMTDGGYDWARVALPKFPDLEQSSPADAADAYLCDVYKRMPVKLDSSGDFTWKDEAAAKKEKMEVCQYVIGGMHPALRKSLAALGQEADQKRIPWSFLSGYRGEYRQRIAAGFKAAPCGSWHGGRQCGEKGYGQGRAADLWTFGDDGRPEQSPNLLFSLIDKIGKTIGLSRPMPGSDPAHVQLLWGQDDQPQQRTRVAHNRRRH